MTFHYRIIYDNREDWDSLLDEDKPYAFGVQAIVQDHPETGVELVYGNDNYIWRYGMWQTVNDNGLTDYLAHTSCAHVLFGRVISRKEWNKIHDQIKDIKLGWLPGEAWED